MLMSLAAKGMSSFIIMISALFKIGGVDVSEGIVDSDLFDPAKDYIPFCTIQSILLL